MVINPVTDKEFQTLQHVLGHDFMAAMAAYDLMRHHGLDAMHGYMVYSTIQAGASEALALNLIGQNCAPVPTSTPASLSKCPLSLSPPSLTYPTSPPPQISSHYRKAPQDWRLWIADRCQARGDKGTLAKSALIELTDVA